MTETKSVAYRQEILFLYEAKDCNPNGDPLDENRPRTDPETGVATVTDVRIKRTVRDYLLSKEPDEKKRLQSGMEILIRDTIKEDGFLAEGKDRADQFLEEASKGKKGKEKVNAIQEAILKGCIDARLFGSTLPVEKGSLKLTGPVQFTAFNRSLHKVAHQLIQQTAAFAGNAKASQKSFAERQILSYALIAAYGVVNEVAARTTQLSDADVSLLLEGLWHGTASLNTHSKMGHHPLLLVRISYSNGKRIGVLPERISLLKEKRGDSEIEDTAIRSTQDYKLDVKHLLDAVLMVGEAVTGIDVHEEPRLICVDGNEQGTFSNVASNRGIKVNPLSL